MQIDTQGRGESCPPDISQSDYSEDEKRRLARRVEISFGARAGSQEFCDLSEVKPDSVRCN